MAMKQLDESDEEQPPLKARLLSRAFRTGPLFQTAMWTQMPLLAMAKPKVTELNAQRCALDLPFGWRTRNIFGTMYFGASLMAAEATTGALVFFHHASRPEKFSFVVTGVSAEFVDKAKSRVTFECNDGPRVAEAFDEALSTGERVDRTFNVVGRREDGTETAKVGVNWYIRSR